jgi:hypothetical protein
VERTTIAGETEELGENLPQRHFVPPQIPYDQVRFRTQDRGGGKPATNRLSYGAANTLPSSLYWMMVGVRTYETLMPTYQATDIVTRRTTTRIFIAVKTLFNLNKFLV